MGMATTVTQSDPVVSVHRRRANCSASACNVFDDPCGFIRVFVFPEPHAEPSRISEKRVGLPVALDVPFELGHPEVGVGGRAGRVLRTAMPEATVDEYGHLGGPEDYVGRPADSCEGQGADAVANAPCVKASA